MLLGNESDVIINEPKASSIGSSQCGQVTSRVIAVAGAVFIVLTPNQRRSRERVHGGFAVFPEPLGNEFVTGPRAIRVDANPYEFEDKGGFRFALYGPERFA